MQILHNHTQGRHIMKPVQAETSQAPFMPMDQYEQQGYDAHFRPNYVHIAPSMYDLILRWHPEPKNEQKKLPD